MRAAAEPISQSAVQVLDGDTIQANGTRIRAALVVVLDTAYPVASARRGVAKFTDGLLLDELRQLIEFVKRN
jgi:hypothetical protein